MQELGIYLHWPFCKSKCPYCDFFSRVDKKINQDDIISNYLRQLCEYRSLIGAYHIKSVFFGGGTPSLITPYNLERILKQIDDLWGLDTYTEISLEANPNTNTPNLFASLRSAGINRLSLGVQSFNDDELKFLGRSHNSTQAFQAIDDMQKHFANCSIDLMYALPDQTPHSWQKQLQQACQLGLKHISLYQLTIEDGTVFASKKIQLLEEDKASKLYLLTEDFLQQFGLHKYEVSNYATSEFQSRHNLIYWQGGEYIGIGQSAHGRLKLNNKWFAQTDNLKLEALTPEERAEEMIIMGLRLTEGIDKTQFNSICGLNFDNFINQDFLASAVAQGLLCHNDTHLFATRNGFLVLDKLIEGLCC